MAERSRQDRPAPSKDHSSGSNIGFLTKLIRGKGTTTTSRQNSTDSIPSQSSSSSIHERDNSRSPPGSSHGHLPGGLSMALEREKSMRRSGLGIGTGAITPEEGGAGLGITTGMESLDAIVPATSHPARAIPELIAVIKNEGGRKQSGTGTEMSKVEAILLLTEQIHQHKNQAQIERDIQQTLKEQGSSEGGQTGGQATSRKDQPVPEGAGSREDLLNIALPLCSPHVARDVRSSGFLLLAAILELPATLTTTPIPIQFQPFSLAGNILSLPETLQIPSTISQMDPLKNCQCYDILARTACLQALTHGGKDISCSLDMVKVVLQWTRLAAMEWVKACAGSGREKDEVKGFKVEEAGLGMSGMEQERGKGSRGSIATGHMLEMRDPSTTTMTTFSTLGDAHTSGDTELRASHTLNFLSDFLLSIMKHNLPLFAQSDISAILHLYLDTIKRGIRHTPQNHPILEPSFAGYGETSRAGRAETVTQPAVSNARARSGSILSRQRKPSKVSAGTPVSSGMDPSSPISPTSAVPSPAMSAQAAVGRSSSVRGRVDKASATTALSVPSFFDEGPPQPAQNLPLWAGMLPTVIKLIEFLLHSKSLSPIDLPPIMSLLSLSLGWHATTTKDPAGDIIVKSPLHQSERNSIASLVKSILGSAMIGRSGERALRGVLGMDRGAGRNKRTYDVAQDGGLRGRDRLLGVISIVRDLLKATHQQSNRSEANQIRLSANFNLNSFAPSLISAMRFSHSASAAQTDDFANAWHDIDLEILGIVQDHLRDLERAVGAQSQSMEQSLSGSAMLDARTGAVSGRDAWVEGELLCEFLEMAKDWIVTFRDSNNKPLILGDNNASQRTGWTIHTILTTLFSRLPIVLGQMQSSSTFSSFFHPDYVNILVQMSAHLPETTAIQLLHYYEREGICLPPTQDWIDNIDRILQAFYIIEDASCVSPAGRILSPSLRRATADLILKHVFDYVQEFSALRAELVSKVLFTAFEKTLAIEPDPDLEKMAWHVVVVACTAEGIEKDEVRRKHRAEMQNLGQTMPVPPLSESVEGECFSRARNLFFKVVRGQSCSHQSTDVGQRRSRHPPTRSRAPAHIPLSMPKVSEGEKEKPAAPAGLSFKGIIEAMSPTSAPKELPSLASHLSGPANPSGGNADPQQAADHHEDGDSHPLPDSPEDTLQRHSCRSLRAISAAISLFTRLAFSLPPSITSGATRLGRLPASSRCIVIFRDLLQLVEYSEVIEPTGPHRVTPIDQMGSPTGSSVNRAACTPARLVLLQWLMRMRANKQHRIWIKADLGSAAQSSASMLQRGAPVAPELSQVGKAEEGDVRRRSGRAELGNVPGERGRLERNLQDVNGRSRSRSRQPSGRLTTTLWTLPETIEFECPSDGRPSEGMTTFDARALPGNTEDVTGPVGIWLPISEYLSIINDLLERDPDWDIVSYILVFLPLQLANKHFFCGPRAAEGINRLQRIVTEGLRTDSFIPRVQLPANLRKSDVRAVAYQTSTILISYKRLFDKSQRNAIVESLIKGVSTHQRTAIKPCVQALIVAAYELGDNLVTYLPPVLEQLSIIMGTPAVSVHILEFLCSIGQIPALYGNFTDMQYKAVFQVALKYIEIHNDEMAKVNSRAGDDREGFTLSQHVIMLSYFVIYTWYMALPLTKRVAIYPHILRQLILAFPVQFDESAEVCFDWLTRYTYGNADPKPANSHIRDIVMQGADEALDKQNTHLTKYWILGNSIIAITAQPRSGWATITTRRASGTVSILCKIENVPSVGLGEDDADLTELPAILRGDRSAARVDDLHDQPDGEVPAAKANTDAASDPNFGASSPTREIESQYNFIWSGSAPSQRRKDVVIDPSFLGLQLSAYPYISVDTPRGRFVPADDANLQRALRTLDTIPVIDTHRIAVLYVGPGQKTEDEIFSNTTGSPAFLRFIAGLGRLIKLKGQRDVFTGGLDIAQDEDGEYAYAWWDDLSQVVYHAPHLMPNPKTPPGEKPNYSAKKRHVGNDFVKIVFNDSGSDYEFETIQSQFQFVNVVISAHTSGVSGNFNDSEEHDFYKVTIQRIKGIPDFGAVGDFKLISAKALPLVIRQLAYFANVIAQLHQHTMSAGCLEYVTPWRARWQAIDRLKQRLPQGSDNEQLENMSEVDKRQTLRDFTRGF